MSEPPPDAAVFRRLHSEEHANLLDIIDQLRLHGIKKSILLPQLIVCGAQSSGKSSVLAAITGVPFPTKCDSRTVFAIELVLYRSQVSFTAVSIVPGRSRTTEEKRKLLAFGKTESFRSTSDIPSLVDAAKKCLTELNTSQPNAVFEDVLRITSSGPDRPHLSIVDLPSLVRSEDWQQTAAYAETVSKVVESYMKRSWSIILAVVTTENDHENQIILNRAKAIDPQGKRTLGVITKPDTLLAGSEKEMAFMALARNEHVKLELGWHVLRNRDFDSRNMTVEEHEVIEREFFSKSSWANLPPRDVGVAKLNVKLQDLLMQTTGSQLPEIIGEIQVAINSCEEHLSRLGEPRTSIAARRHYLMETSQDFHDLAKEAVKGSYESDFFEESPSDEGNARRLRAVVQNLNEEFAEKMHERGHRHRIVTDEEWDKLCRTPSALLSRSGGPEPELISRSEFTKKVANCAKKTQGRELQGTVNPLLIGGLFQEQSAPWQTLASGHVKEVGAAVNRFLELALRKLMDRASYHALYREVIEPAMEEKMRLTTTKLEEVLWPHKKIHPITYDRIFARNVREIQTRSLLKRALAQLGPEQLASLDDAGVSRLVSGSSVVENVSMDEYACSDILDSVEAYYKVAINRFIDNVAAIVIERCLLQDLGKIYCPLGVSIMDDEMVNRVAAESENVTAERRLLNAKLRALNDGLSTCKRYLVRKPPGITQKFEFKFQVPERRLKTPAIVIQDPSSKSDSSPLSSISDEHLAGSFRRLSIGDSGPNADPFSSERSPPFRTPTQDIQHHARTHSASHTGSPTAAPGSTSNASVLTPVTASTGASKSAGTTPLSSPGGPLGVPPFAFGTPEQSAGMKSAPSPSPAACQAPTVQAAVGDGSVFGPS